MSELRTRELDLAPEDTGNHALPVNRENTASWDFIPEARKVVEREPLLRRFLDAELKLGQAIPDRAQTLFRALVTSSARIMRRATTDRAGE